MDKYDLNLRMEKLKKAAKEGDWATAMNIADQIDWRKVNSVSMLSLVSEVYEKNGDFAEAKEILLLAYEKAPLGKRLLYKLTTLSIDGGDVNEAEAFYREFYDAAPDDPRQHILRYLILKEKKAPIPQLINTLEQYNSQELNEKWLYELAELYHQAGRSEDCVKVCDQIMLMFGIGKYVDKAIDLKKNREGVDLTEYQQSLIDNREKYEERLRSFREQEDDVPEPTPEEKDEPEYKGEVEFKNDEVSKEELDEVAKLKESVAALGIVKSEHDGATDATKVFSEIKHSDPVPVIIATPAAVAVAAAEISAGANAEEEPEVNAEPVPTVNFIVERKTPAEGLERAKELIKLMHNHTGSTNQVAKINALKLSGMGVKASRTKLAGRDIIIDEAGDLTSAAVNEIIDLIKDEPGARIIIMIDNPMQLNSLVASYPELTDVFHIDRDEAAEVKAEEPVKEPEIIPAEPEKAPAKKAAPEEETEEYETPQMNPNDRSAQMDIDEFADYCQEYARSIDCSISGKSKLALYERIEIMEEDGIPLTKNNAVALIEEAADRAEKPTFGQRIAGLFSAKYDKDDMLILKEEHFIP